MYCLKPTCPTTSSSKTLNSRPIFFNSSWCWSLSLPKILSLLKIGFIPITISSFFPHLFLRMSWVFFLTNSKRPNYSTRKFFKSRIFLSEDFRHNKIFEYRTMRALPISLIQSHECGRLLLSISTSCSLLSRGGGSWKN